MKQIITIALFLFALSSAAQQVRKPGGVKYNTKNPIDSYQLKLGGTCYTFADRSDKIRFVGRLTFANIDINKGDAFKWAVGGEVDFFMKKWLSFHADYNYTLFDLQRLKVNNPNYDNFSENEVKAWNYTELGVRVFIRDMPSKAKVKIILESRRASYNTIVNYYIEPKLACRRVLAVRGGVYSSRAIVNTDLNSQELARGDHGAVLAKDGTELGYMHYTNSQTRGGYIGIADLLMVDAVTKNTFKKGALYRSRFVKEMYADILFGATTFDPIITNGVAHEIIANDKGSFQTSKIGGRIGVKRTIPSGKLNQGAKLEGGYRPAVKGTGWYLSIGYSFAWVK